MNYAQFAYRQLVDAELFALLLTTDHPAVQAAIKAELDRRIEASGWTGEEAQAEECKKKTTTNKVGIPYKGDGQHEPARNHQESGR